MGRKKKTFTTLSPLPLGNIRVPDSKGVPTLTSEAIEEMARLLARNGQQDPILVHKSGRAQHRIISGRRRFLAAKSLGWEEIACVVLDDSMEKEIAVIDRLQSKQYDPWELADVLASIRSRLNWSQAQLGAAIDRSRDFIANILVINQITKDAKTEIMAMEGADLLTTRHLRYIARSAPKHQVQVAVKILSDQMSTKRLEREHHETAPKSPSFRLTGVRDPLEPDMPDFPITYRDWRKYHRQLTTDLRRIERQEQQELARARAAINQAKILQRQVKNVTGIQRKKLEKALRLAKKKLEILGNY